jgi:flagellar hook-length control protein FliK
MERTDYTLLALTQTMTQTRQTTGNAGKSEKDGQFQGLMDKKKEMPRNDTTTETGKTDNGTSKAQTKPEKQDEEEKTDPMTMELAYAQMMKPDVVPTEVQNPQGLEAVVPITVEEPSVAAVDTAVEEISDAADIPAQEVQPELPETVEQAPEMETAAVSSEPTVEPVPVQTEEPETQDGQSQQNDLPSEAQDEDTHIEVKEAPEAPAQPVFRDVEPVMIKVGEAPPAEDAQQVPDLDQQVMEPLSKALSEGETKVEIQLSPRSLGNVTVELTQKQDGALNVVLTAENGHTRDLLKQHIGSLQDLLGGESQRTVQVEVTRPQQTQHEAPNYDGRNGHEQGGQQEQRQQRHTQQNSQDFLQQLRLGLIPLEVQAS